MFDLLIKNGFYIHLLQACLYYTTQNIYISSIVAIKMYSVNYFYWYGNRFTFLPNPSHNWIKQFTRMTDTGHFASFLPLFFPSILPVAHNVHFLIMSGYWIGKCAFDLKDADKLNFPDILSWHSDLCTYIHHTVPYFLIHYLFAQQQQVGVSINCDYEYNTDTLKYTFAWLYGWLFFIYIPWRLYTGDPIYSILDAKQTPKKYIFGFVICANVLVLLSNVVGKSACKLYPHHIA